MEEQPDPERSVPEGLKRLEEFMGHAFAHPQLLLRAVTHRSWTNEHESDDLGHNESLEFLGDAILGFLVASMIYRRFPDLTEGELSKIKSYLVSATNLRQLAEGMKLGDFLRLSRGEEKTGGRGKRAILVDAYEAVVGAVYLDGGVDAAAAFVEGQLSRLMEDPKIRQLTSGDFKSALQEELHNLGRAEPVYRVANELGPDHRKIFIIQVWVGERMLAEGSGPTKKEAQQVAARLALDRMRTASSRDPCEG